MTSSPIPVPGGTDPIPLIRGAGTDPATLPNRKEPKMADHNNNQKPTAKPTRRKRGLSGMAVFTPYLASTKAKREAERLADERDCAERRAITVQPSENVANTILLSMGHSPDCIARLRRGFIFSCNCSTKPMDDPAVALGLALHCEKYARTGSVRFPKSVARLVEAGAKEGDEACRMMLERLRRSGWVEQAGEQDDTEPKPEKSS